MTALPVHFLLGIAGALAVFVIATRASGVERFSFPSAVLLIGLCCSLLAHFVSPWATAVVIGLYAFTSAHELKLDRREAARRRDEGNRS